MRLDKVDQTKNTVQVVYELDVPNDCGILQREPIVGLSGDQRE